LKNFRRKWRRLPPEFLSARRVLIAVCIAALAAVWLTGQSNIKPWWQNAVIYEIYPRSFADSNGDGIGDLKGITNHLDYLKDLGVDGIWITPFFRSPQVDFGYDISDYEDIDPQYGTLADCDQLLSEAKNRNIRVLFDFVANHTSDKHPWFVESRSSRTNSKADWYVWRDGRPGNQPPSNWISIFGGSAWQLDQPRNQFYYHAFYKEQPDLNWRNLQVRKAMYDVMHFWMKRGVAGFRLDAVPQLFEDPQLRDEIVARPGKTAYGDPILTRNRTDNLPEVDAVLREMRQVTNEFPDGVLVGETYVPTIKDLAKLYGPNHDEIHLPMDTQLGFGELSATRYRDRLREAETQLDGNTPLLVFNNHDRPRSISRLGDGSYKEAMARMLATLELTPRASVLLYYGEELGMENDDPKRREDVKDIVGIRGWPEDKGRDGERKPMQWNGGANAGFSTARMTWLPVAPGYEKVNAAAESRNSGSILNYYRTLLRLRKTDAALRDGDFALVNEDDPNVLSFLRRAPNGETVLVSLNCTSQPRAISIRGLTRPSAVALVSSFIKPGDPVRLDRLNLPPYGTLVAHVR
jgi:alpha-glucosidase